MRHETDDIDWTLLDRFAANETTAEEAAQVEQWLDRDPARRALLDGIRAPTPSAQDWDVARAWSVVSARAQLSLPSARAARRWSGVPALARAAAVLLLLGGAALMGRALLQRSEPSVIEMLTAVTARSERDTVELEDASVIVLAAASRLDYPRSFGATSREVRLTGEALFQVASDRTRPFIVRAGRAVIEVVGTQFVTRTAADTESGVVAVAVVEGAVSVRGSGDAVMVRPGQVAHVDVNGTATVATADLDSYVDWTEGRLVFNDTPIADVLDELQRWYPLEFHADSTVMARRVTARLRAGSLDETIDALALALGATYRRTDDTITFTMK